MPNNEKPTDAEIVRVLAERVMGWRVLCGEHGDLWVEMKPAIGAKHYPLFLGPTDFRPKWNPLESWADAGMLFDRMREMGKVFILKADGLRDGTYNPGYTALCDNTPRCDAASGPRAISRAAYEWAMSQEQQNE